MGTFNVNELLGKPGRPPMLGTLAKGGKKGIADNGKPKVGRDLDHFRFIPDEVWAEQESPKYPGKTFAEELEISFKEVYGDQPRELKVRFPHSLWRENILCLENSVWGSNKKRTRRCDGETCNLWKKEDGSLCYDPIPCAKSPDDRECPAGCKAYGLFALHLPEWGQVGIVKLRTKSIIDIENIITESKPFADGIAGVPFVLYRKKEDLPMFDAQKGRMILKSHWMVHLRLDLPELKPVQQLNPGLYQPKVLQSFEEKARIRIDNACHAFNVDMKLVLMIATKSLKREIKGLQDIRAEEECLTVEGAIHNYVITRDRWVNACREAGVELTMVRTIASDILGRPIQSAADIESEEECADVEEAIRNTGRIMRGTP